MQLRDFAQRRSKRGLAAPFVLLGFAVAAWGSADGPGSPVTWTAALVLLGVGAACLPPASIRWTTPIAIAVLAFFALIIANNAFLSPAYWVSAPFHAAFLAMGLIVGRRLDAQSRGWVLCAVGAFVGLLALMGVWQVSATGQSRATAILETPATLATVLNLALLPAIVVLAFGERPGRWVLPGIVLAAGIAATVSRGGWLGLAVGLLVAVLFARRQGFHLRPSRALVVVAVLGAGWLSVQAVPMLKHVAGADSAGLHEVLGDKAQESSVARLELYELAWQAAQENVAGGIGYRGFHHVLEANRQKVSTFADEYTTDFVHNDYLQVLLELGLPGFAALLAMVMVPFMGMRHRLRAPAGVRLVAVAMLAGVATMAIQAAVDFPFYVPVCLLGFGLAMGVLDRCMSSEPAPVAATPNLRPRFLQIGVATLAAIVLLPPVVAEVAAAHAHRSWRAADPQAAAYWYEVARRFEPRDWRVHLYAGHFWYFQAAQTGKPEAARLADEAFAAGMAANPKEVRNLLGRVSVHRDFAGLLQAPADGETLRQWVRQAASMAPNHRGVRVELARLGVERSP